MADVPFFSAINTVIKACELVYKIAEVSGESAVFVRSILRVRDDLQETERLLYCPSVKAHLASVPEKEEWIKKIILDAKESLNEIGIYIERARADKERDGTVSLATRWAWVMSDHDKLKNRREGMNTCHTSLGNVLTYLVPLETRAPLAQSMGVSTADDLPPPSYDDTEVFLNPRMLRKQRNRPQSEQYKFMEATTNDKKSTETITDYKTTATNTTFSQTPTTNTATYTRPTITEPQRETLHNSSSPGSLDNVEQSPPPVLNDRFESINPYGPVDPFAFYSELPADSYAPSINSSVRSNPYEIPNLSQSPFEAAPLPQTNGYNIHELPSEEFSRSRNSRVSSVSSYQAYSPSNTFGKSPVMSVTELPATIPMESYQHHQQPYQQPSPFLPQTNAPFKPYHAQTYPPQTQTYGGYTSIPPISSVISPDVSRLSLASPPVPEKLSFGTQELPSNSRSMYEMAPLVSPLASTISLVSTSSTVPDLSPEARVRQRRKALMRAVIGDG